MKHYIEKKANRFNVDTTIGLVSCKIPMCTLTVHNKKILYNFVSGELNYSDVYFTKKHSTLFRTITEAYLPVFAIVKSTTKIDLGATLKNSDWRIKLCAFAGLVSGVSLSYAIVSQEKTKAAINGDLNLFLDKKLWNTFYPPTHMYVLNTSVAVKVPD
jgi:hypothetical protein